MHARAALVLVAALLAGLLAALARKAEPSRPEPPPLAEVPVVAIRGQPLGEFEEPLPPGARVRIGSTRYRHPTNLREGVSLNGRDYLITIMDGRLTLTHYMTGHRVWIRPTGSKPSYLWGGLWGIGFAVSPDGRRFVTNDLSGDDGGSFIHVWDLDPDVDHPIRPRIAVPVPFDRARYGVTLDFGPDGRELLVHDANNLVAFDVLTGHMLRRIESETVILDLAPAAGLFLTSSEPDPTAQVSAICGNFGSLPSYRFHPKTAGPDDDRLILDLNLVSRRRGTTARGQPYGSFDLIVRNTISGQVVATIPAPRDPEATVGHFHLSPDGRYMSGEFGRDVLVWEIESGRRVLRMSPNPTAKKSYTFADVWFAPDGRTVVALEWPDRERHFDLASGREMFARPHKATVPEQAVPGSDLLVTVDEAGAILRRDARTREVLAPPPGYAGVKMDVSPDGQLIAIGDANGRLDVWKPSGSLVTRLNDGGEAISALAFSPDGRRLAACDRGRTVRIWSVGAWAERDRIEVPADDDKLCPEHLVFSPDGSRLLMSQRDVMALWDFAAREWVWDQPGYQLNGEKTAPPAFFPDGEHFFTSYFVRLNSRLGPNSTDPQLHGDPQYGHSEHWLGLCVHTFALSPDGTRVATPKSDCDSRREEAGIKIRDVATGKLIQSFPESHSTPIREGQLRFSPDGRRLVTCDDAGHAHVWEVASGQLAFTLTYPDGAIHDARFTADGRSLITSNHREVIVWDLAPTGPVADPWADLGHEAPRAEQARRALLAEPEEAVELLRSRLRPVKPVDPAGVVELVRGLDHARFQHRERSAADLWALGRRVLPLLREAKPASAEGRTRLAGIIDQLSAGPTADEQRQVRAVEVLEQIDSPAARRLIDDLATGDPAATVTEEATKARGRRRP